MSLLSELKRRNLYRVGAGYIVVAWVLLQVADVLAPALRLPDWFLSAVVFVLLLGFPVALILAWVFEVTPEGIKRDRGPDNDFPQRTGGIKDVVLVVVLVAIAGFIAWDRFTGSADVRPTGDMESITAVDEQPLEATGDREAVSQDADEATGPTIAVLPFADMSVEGDQAYMGDGIAEEMLNLLAKIPEIRVISRSSAFSFKGTNTDIPTIAERLGATHVLEGSVRKGGDQLRITAQLIEADSDIHLWSETYDRQLDNIFLVQDEIAQAVVESLRLELVGEAPTAVPIDPEAYELALKARYHWLRRGPGDEQEALGLYRASIALDPDYGPAWTGLSVALAVAAIKGRMDRESGFAEAHEAATRGLELSPHSAEAHVRMGQALARAGDRRGMTSTYERALELDPDSALALGVMAQHSWRLNEPERALDYYRRAQLADPMSSVMASNMALNLIQLGRYDEAEITLARAMRVVGGEDAFLPHLVRLAMGREQWNEAMEFARRIELPQIGLSLEIMVLHGMGEEDLARGRYEDWMALEPAPGAYEQAQVLAYLGDIDEAFDLLEAQEGIEDRGGFVLLDDLYANLHDDPRWRVLAERMAAVEWQ